MAPRTKSVSDQLADAMKLISQKNGRLAVLERAMRQSTQEKDSAERIRTEIFGLAEYTPEPPQWIDHEPGKSSTGVPVIPLGDWHWGEKVDPDQVGQKNKYNRAIARKRVRLLYDAIVDLCFHHMTNPHYPGVVLPVLGDMITGAIHEELLATNDGPVAWSIIEVENMLIGLILALSKKFPKVFVPCVPGNHARNTIRPRYKNRVFESYEWLIFTHIEQYFRRHPTVSVHVPNEVDAHFRIYGHRFMITHGDTLGVKGGDGMIGALGPIARGAIKIGRAEATIGRDFDTLIIGHYHIRVPVGDATPVLVNPCMIGYNEYARLALRVPFARPAQSLLFVHAKRGLTAQWPIYLDDAGRKVSREPWCVWDKAEHYDPEMRLQV